MRLFFMGLPQIQWVGNALAAPKISGKFLNARSAAQRVKGRRPGIVTQKNAYIWF
jgi:hypothetical protein